MAERFWHSLSELALTLSDTQQLVLGLEEAGGEPEAIRDRLRTMQVPRRGGSGGWHRGAGSATPRAGWRRHCGRRLMRCRASWTRWAAWAWS